ncbi:hypothetical protein BDZ89DRAFT_1045891 [Hymenopellis radicata]|nr:hypothetical protein BDZ89DRAFT_1045891 [Hymenopellis radicata]
MTDHRAHVVYRRLLSRTGHGYPLWIPDPDENLPEAYRKDGINIGDVGLLTEDGGFDFLFNVHASANDPVNSGGVPWDFLPLSALNDPHPIRKTCFIHKEKSSITSAHVTKKSIAMEASADTVHSSIFGGGGFGFQFSTRKAQAAVLMLPDGAHRYVAKNTSIYERYASENGIAWYQYANGTLGRGAPNGSLYLVTGCDKCRSWGTAAVSQPEETQEVSLKFIAAGIAEGGIALHSSCSTDFGTETRCFPPSTITVHDMENQCVFVRGIAISVKESLIRRALRVEVGRWSGVPGDLRHKRFGTQSPSSNFPRSLSFRSSISPSSSRHSGHSHSDTHILPVDRVPDLDGEGDSEDLSDAEVEVSRFPLYSDAFLQPQNLSSRIANHILSMIQSSDADVAVVNDEAWISVVNEDHSFQTASDDDEDLLFREVLKRHDISVSNGIARLCRHTRVLDVDSDAATSDNTWTIAPIQSPKETTLPSSEHLNRLPIPPLITLPRYPNPLEPKASSSDSGLPSPDMWETAVASAVLRPSRKLTFSQAVDSGGDAAHSAMYVEKKGEHLADPGASPQ